MKKYLLILLCLLTANVFAQSVGIGTLTPNASAQLDITSTTQGLLIPRLTLVQRNSIVSPATGLMVYQTDNTTGLYTYNGAGWQAVSGGGGLTIPFSTLYGGSSNAFEIDMIGGTNNTGIKSQTYNAGSKAFFGEARGNNSIGGYFTVAGSPTGASALQTDVGDVYLGVTSGNVGIGLTGASVTEKLHVDGNMKMGNVFWSNASNDRVLKFGDGNFVTIGETGQDDRMTLTARNFIFTPSSSYPGYIGINTTTPSSPLSFGNIIGEKINFWNTDATHNYGIGVQAGLLQIHSNDATADIAFGSGISSAGAAFTETMRIKGNGNVGIGTTTPGSKLDVLGNVNFTGDVGATGASSGFRFDDRTLGNANSWEWYASAGKASLYDVSTATDRLVIDNTGNVGIGTITPGSKLDVSGNVNFTGNVGASGASSGFRFDDRTLGTVNGWQWYASGGKAYLYDQLNSVNRLVIDNTGNIGIGNSTPGAKLDIAGNIKIADGNQLAGRVLTTDNAGLATWADLPSANSAFRARHFVSNSIASGANYKVQYGLIEYDQSSGVGGSYFTIPVSGVYHFDASVRWTLTATGAPYVIHATIYSDMTATVSEHNYQVVPAVTSGELTSNLSIDNYFPAGDKVYLEASQSSGINQTVGGFTVFTGHRVN